MAERATEAEYELAERGPCRVLRLVSSDGTNRLTRARVRALALVLERLAADPRPLILAGNPRFFSAGADLHEIAALSGPEAIAFARLGQALMQRVAGFPAPVCAAIEGYCMGGGLDLALACHLRIAAPGAVFGHRGAALGLMTGWGGTQRLPALLGRARALHMFAAAESATAAEALRVGLVCQVAPAPVEVALARLEGGCPPTRPGAHPWDPS